MTVSAMDQACAIPNMLRKRRTQLGWSQVKLAATAGVHKSTVERAESRGGTASVDSIVRLASVMGMALTITCAGDK